MQDQRNAAMDARRQEEKDLTNQLLASKGRDSTGRRKDQKTVPQIRAANIEKIKKRIKTYEGVIEKQKAKGQDTRSATGSLIKLNEELLALQKIGTQDKAHEIHLGQVAARQHSGPGGVLRDPAFAEKPAPTDQDPFAAAGVVRPSAPRMTQEQANKRFLGRGFAGGYQAPTTSHAEMQAAQQAGDFSMFMEDKTKLGKESDVFGFGDSEREKRMRARVQAEGDWRVGHRESMGLLRKEEKDRQTARFRRARGYSEGGSVPGAAPAAPAAVFAPRGTDTVPAMLTPGEFVINKSSAQSIGYNRLNSMNRMAQGGVVQPQYLSNGGTSSSAYSTNGGDVAAQLAESQASMNKLADALGKIPQSIDLNLNGDSRVIIDFGADMVPQVKKYFQEWYQEALKGPQGKRLDGSSPDPSIMNTA